MISVYYRSKATGTPNHCHFSVWRDASWWAKENKNGLAELCLPDECHSCCDPMNEYVGITPKCDACELESEVYDESDAEQRFLSRQGTYPIGREEPLCEHSFEDKY